MPDNGKDQMAISNFENEINVEKAKDENAKDDVYQIRNIWVLKTTEANLLAILEKTIVW